ncbi:hypothetical protein TNCV_4115761 [Trichonephila clavipes]|nr:hypothetical protein TNCV_4115761 [Trichonephila clavipes]
MECDATFHTSYHTLHNIIQQLLRQFIPFICECTDEGVLVYRRIVSTSNLPPKASHTFSMGFRSGERAGQYETLNTLAVSDNPEQRVLSMTCCVVVHKNKFITDSTTEKDEHEEVELHQCIVGPS